MFAITLHPPEQETSPGIVGKDSQTNYSPSDKSSTVFPGDLWELFCRMTRVGPRFSFVDRWHFFSETLSARLSSNLLRQS